MVAGFAVERLTDPIKILAKAAEMEKNSTRDYNKWARECAENLDAASKKIFEELVGDEEMHFGAFDKQQDHIRQFGPAYLALQSFGKEAPAGVGA
jgi:bacterioferritin